MNVDKTLSCADCSQAFTFTASEQDFFAERGFTEPRRCPSCRAARKASRGSDSSYGGGSTSSYGNGGGYGSRPSTGGYGGGASRGPREMFAATCSACGQETEVPFRPTSGKPVYCSACFAQRRA
jgi:CxxC-x17-CxxC domain-containing protein